MKMKKLLYIGHSYHNKTKSTIFLQEMFSENYEVTTFCFDPYTDDIHTHFNSLNGSHFDIVVLFQILPSYKMLKRTINFDKMTIFPMYDGSMHLSDYDWIQYRNCSIINFSLTLHRKLKKIGLSSYYIQYFPKPFENFQWGREDSIFFWQRLTEFNINHVEKLFDQSRIKHIHLHQAIDPSQCSTEPSKTIKDKLTMSSWYNDKSEMLSDMEKSAIYIAPRHYEGIGLSFLEAMAMGRCVVAFNNPTMNEYIKNGKTGFLFNDLSIINIIDIKQIQQESYKFIVEGYAEFEKKKYNILEWIEYSKRSNKISMFKTFIKAFYKLKARPSIKKLLYKFNVIKIINLCRVIIYKKLSPLYLLKSISNKLWRLYHSKTIFLKEYCVLFYKAIVLYHQNDHLKLSKRIAVFSTLPPDQSGIAIYTLRTHLCLPSHYDLFRDVKNINGYFETLTYSDNRIVNIFPVSIYRIIKKIKIYTHKIFVIGNSDHHSMAIEQSILSKSELDRFYYFHEAKVIGGILGWCEYKDIDFDNIMKSTYGNNYSGKLGVLLLLQLSQIKKIFVNNEIAKKMILDEVNNYLDIDIYVLYLPIKSNCNLIKNSSKDSSIVNIGLFGIPNDDEKSTRLIIDVISDIYMNNNKIKLIIAGHKVKKYLTEGNLLDCEYISFFDSPEDDHLEEIMNSVDFAIQLRPKYHGESSGCVCQLLALGKKIITTEGFVSNEFFDYCTFVPKNISRYELSETIKKQIYSQNCFNPSDLINNFSFPKLAKKIYSIATNDININSKQVTIITIVYNLINNNRVESFRKCIESVHNQTYQNIEHIIIDGASNDGTLDLINEYVEKGWVICFSEKDTGVYDAMNKGIKRAQGEYINFLNSDDCFNCNDAVELSVFFINKYNADFSFATCSYLDEHDKNIGILKPVIGRFYIRMPFCHQTMFVKKSVLTEINGFDTYYTSAGDFDHILRICLLNKRFIEVPYNIVNYKLGGISDTKEHKGVEECITSLMLNFNKCIGLNFNYEVYSNMFLNFIFPKKIYDNLLSNQSIDYKKVIKSFKPKKIENNMCLLDKGAVPFIDKSIFE